MKELTDRAMEMRRGKSSQLEEEKDVSVALWSITQKSTGDISNGTQRRRQRCEPRRVRDARVSPFDSVCPFLCFSLSRVVLPSSPPRVLCCAVLLSSSCALASQSRQRRTRDAGKRGAGSGRRGRGMGAIRAVVSHTLDACR